MKPSNPAKINLTNIKKFFQGWFRYIIYFLTKRTIILKRLEENEIMFLPKHKKEQFEWRLMVANPKCIEGGSCIICGCYTPQLQMTDAACEGKCYPEMMNEEDWKNFKKQNQIII